eukprot:s1269_g19.t1
MKCSLDFERAVEEAVMQAVVFHQLGDVRPLLFRSRMSFSRRLRLSTPLQGDLSEALKDWRLVRAARGEVCSKHMETEELEERFSNLAPSFVENQTVLLCDMPRASSAEVPGWLQSFRAAARLSQQSQRMSKMSKRSRTTGISRKSKESAKTSRRSRESRPSLALLSQEQSFIRDVFRPDDGVLDFGGQQLGDAIAVALAAAWPLLGRLQRLHLGGNDITDEGMAALIAAMQAHPSPSLRRLNLRGNHLGPASVEALASLLPSLPTLESLDLGGNGLENSAAQFPGLRTWF